VRTHALSQRAPAEAFGPAVLTSAGSASRPVTPRTVHPPAERAVGDPGARERAPRR
jgi:hypothetical protein